MPKGTIEGGSSTKHYGKLAVKTCLDAYVDSADLSDLMKRLKAEQKKLGFLKQSLGYDGLIGYFETDFEEQAKRVHARVYKTRARLERKAREKALKGHDSYGAAKQLMAPAEFIEPIMKTDCSARPFWPPMPDGQAT